MECMFGIVGADFVVVATDTMDINSILLMRSRDDRSRCLNSRNLVLYAGDRGESVDFVEYIQKNIKLNEIRSSYEYSTSSCAGFIRRTLADSLRSRNPISTNVLVAGFDVELSRPKLYWIDMYGTSMDVPYGCHGYGSYFCYSTMDRYYKPNMSRDDAVALIKKCIFELKTRFIVNLRNWQIQVVSKEGIETAFSVDSPTATFAENIPLKASY